MDFESETFVATTLRARDLSRGVDSDCTDTLIAHTLRAKSNLAHRPDIDTLVTHSLRGEGFDASEDGTGRGTPLVPVTLAFTQNQRDEVRPLTVAGALAAEPGTKQQTYVAFDCKAGTGFQSVAADGVTPTLRAMSALGRDNSGGQLAVQHDMAVRRLTPRECERLQGFPDDYTQILWRKKAAEDCPDGPRYRALGNSMAVPVMRWIGRRIQAAGQRP